MSGGLDRVPRPRVACRDPRWRRTPVRHQRPLCGAALPQLPRGCRRPSQSSSPLDRSHAPSGRHTPPSRGRKRTGLMRKRAATTARAREAAPDGRLYSRPPATTTSLLGSGGNIARRTQRPPAVRVPRAHRLARVRAPQRRRTTRCRPDGLRARGRGSGSAAVGVPRRGWRRGRRGAVCIAARGGGWRACRRHPHHRRRMCRPGRHPRRAGDECERLPCRRAVRLAPARPRSAARRCMWPLLRRRPRVRLA